jgi:hypothetical protein
VSRRARQCHSGYGELGSHILAVRETDDNLDAANTSCEERSATAAFEAASSRFVAPRPVLRPFNRNRDGPVALRQEQPSFVQAFE